MKLTPVQLAERVEAWQQRLASLGVAHFRIECVTLTDDVPGNVKGNAAVSISESYDSFHIWFDNEFIEAATGKELDESIIHELLHVAMRDLDNSIDLAEPWMPEQTYHTFYENVRQKRETFVERLARQLYALYRPRKNARSSR